MRGHRLTKLVENFKFGKWNTSFLDEFLNFFEVPWVPLTFLIKFSSGAHFFVVRHYARSGFAFAESSPNRFHSTHVVRNA